MVPVLFFGFFYYFQRKDDSTLSYKYKNILELEKKVECYYKIDDHKVYIIQKDGKRIELNQYWYLKLTSSPQREQKKRPEVFILLVFLETCSL